MEDYKIDIMIDSGPSAKTVQIKLNPFTLIGATTRSGLLSAPLRSRFSINSRFEYYNVNVLEKIIARSSKILDIPIDKNASLEVSKRSRGTSPATPHPCRHSSGVAHSIKSCQKGRSLDSGRSGRSPHSRFNGAGSATMVRFGSTGQSLQRRRAETLRTF